MVSIELGSGGDVLPENDPRGSLQWVAGNGSGGTCPPGMVSESDLLAVLAIRNQRGGGRNDQNLGPRSGW